MFSMFPCSPCIPDLPVPPPDFLLSLLVVHVCFRDLSESPIVSFVDLSVSPITNLPVSPRSEFPCIPDLPVPPPDFPVSSVNLFASHMSNLLVSSSPLSLCSHVFPVSLCISYHGSSRISPFRMSTGSLLFLTSIGNKISSSFC
jgi:hypothetical protein